MKPNLLNPARLAAILVIVVVAASMLVEATRHPHGYRVLLMRYDSSYCGIDDRRMLIVQVRGSDLRINLDTYTSDAQFNIAIKEALITRAERVVLVAADPDVSYDSVLQRIDAVQSMFPDLRIVLVTPSAPRDTCQWRLAIAPLVPKLGERRTDHLPGEAPPLGFQEPPGLAPNH